MPTRPLRPGHENWDLAVHCHERWTQREKISEIAADIGKSHSTTSRWIEKVESYNNADPAILDSMDAVGTGMVPSLAWAKTKSKDGTSYSVLLKPAPEDAEPREDVLRRVIENIKPAPMVNRPKVTSNDLHNIVPTFDKHLALRVGSYGLERALERIHEGCRDVLERAPRAASLTFIDGGDITHANDESSQTPRNKHPLMVDVSYRDAVEAAVSLADWQIQAGLEHAEHVEYVALEGNHDPATAHTLQMVLEARYQGNERVSVYRKSTKAYAREVGGNLFLSHHGHAKKNAIEKALPEMVRRYRKAWGRATYCELITGHLHHIMSHDTELGFWRRVRPICPLSQYDDEEFYGGLSEVVCTTYAKTGFVKNEVSHVFTPEPHEEYEAA